MQTTGSAVPYEGSPMHATGGQSVSVIWSWLALIVAAAASAGSLYLSLPEQWGVSLPEQWGVKWGMNLKACPLCFYQRTFAMAVFGVLVIGLCTNAWRTGTLSLLVLPLAIGGLGVAVFHVYLEFKGTLECPGGIGDVGTAPKQSLVTLSVLVLLLVMDSVRNRAAAGYGLGVWLGSIVLGVLFAAGAVVSSPPLPPAPTKPYDSEKQPLEMCRPPYQEP
jgi:disulfide bond formation protein DsbB